MKMKKFFGGLLRILSCAVATVVTSGLYLCFLNLEVVLSAFFEIRFIILFGFFACLLAVILSNIIGHRNQRKLHNNKHNEGSSDSEEEDKSVFAEKYNIRLTPNDSEKGIHYNAEEE